MFKLIGLFLALVAISNASDYKITVNRGYIVQGKHSDGVMVKKHDDHQQIVWQEKFDNDNSLTVYYTQISEVTGLVENIKIDNLCNKYKSGTLEHAAKYFILNKFGKTNKCSIKKGKVKISYPMNFQFDGTTENTICGSTISTIQIIRNNPKNSDMTPLLISAWFRGSITGENCE